MGYVLDLGCGSGKPLLAFHLNAEDRLIGIDRSEVAIHIASRCYPSRKFVVGDGEQLPLCDSSVDRVVSSVALPYMHIPSALQEIHRVLRDQGTVTATLHYWRFTLKELTTKAFPYPKAMLYRLLVMSNGIKFHFTGRANGESFQTECGMTRALRRAGFGDIHFNWIDSRWFVTARKVVR